MKIEKIKRTFNYLQANTLNNNSVVNLSCQSFGNSEDCFHVSKQTKQFMNAVKNRDLRYVRKNVEDTNIDINYVNNNGETFLITATKAKQPKIVRTILHNRPDVNLDIKDKIGFTVKDYAEILNQNEILFMLENNDYPYSLSRKEFEKAVSEQLD